MQKITSSCQGCRWAGTKNLYLGPRPYCHLYRAIRDVRCIDWRPK